MRDELNTGLGLELVEPPPARPPWLSSGRIPCLDGLRAIAILLVIFQHACMPYWINGPFLKSTAVFVSGTIGVQSFFAISGFLITTLLLRERERTGRISLGGFYRRRSLRIFPAYLVFLGVLYLLTQLKMLEVPRRDWVACLTYTMNYLSNSTRVVNHIWSLSLEEQFYLIWPFLFVAFGSRAGLIGLPIFLMLAPVFRVAARIYVPENRPLAYSSTLTGMDTIAASCLLALIVYDSKFAARLHLSPRGFRNLGCFCLLVLLASTTLCPLSPEYHLLVGRTVNAAMCTLLVWSVINLADSPVGRLLHWKPFVAIGVLSYSLYLWQQLFLRPEEPHWFCQYPQNLVLPFVAAAISYQAIEKPILRLK